MIELIKTIYRIDLLEKLSVARAYIQSHLYTYQLLNGKRVVYGRTDLDKIFGNQARYKKHKEEIDEAWRELEADMINWPR